jgi:hypothetical protein
MLESSVVFLSRFINGDRRGAASMTATEMGRAEPKGGFKGRGGAGIGDVQIARAVKGEVRENGAGTFPENCSTVTGAVTLRRR